MLVKAPWTSNATSQKFADGYTSRTLAFHSSLTLLGSFAISAKVPHAASAEKAPDASALTTFLGIAPLVTPRRIAQIPRNNTTQVPNVCKVDQKKGWLTMWSTHIWSR